MSSPIQTLTPERWSAATGRRQSLDLQTSMAEAISRLVAAASFTGPGGLGKIKFQKVFSEWPTTLDTHLSPSACVASTELIRYAEAFPTPKLLEDTWYPVGGLGLGLYEVSEGECDFHLEVRAATKKERSAVVAGLESLFFGDGVSSDHKQGSRYGVLVDMPEYWGLRARLSVQEKLLADDAEAAKTNRWEAVFIVRAQGPHVRLDRVAPFTIKVTEVFT